MPPKILRVLIADDSEIVRKGIRNLLSQSLDWQICGECADGEDAVRKTEELRPDVLLLDLSIPRLRGIDVVKALIGKQLTTRIVVISQHNKELLDHLTRGIDIAHAMPKSRLSDDLIPTLRLIWEQTETR